MRGVNVIDLRGKKNSVVINFGNIIYRYIYIYIHIHIRYNKNYIPPIPLIIRNPEFGFLRRIVTDLLLLYRKCLVKDD